MTVPDLRLSRLREQPRLVWPAIAFISSESIEFNSLLGRAINIKRLMEDIGCFSTSKVAQLSEVAFET